MNFLWNSYFKMKRTLVFPSFQELSDETHCNSPFHTIIILNKLFFPYYPYIGPHHIKASRWWKLSNTIIFLKENFQRSQFHHSLSSDSCRDNPKKSVVTSNSQLNQHHTSGKAEITQHYQAGEESTEKCFLKEKMAKPYIGIYIMRIYIKYSW